jgi:hypothetical protein
MEKYDYSELKAGDNVMFLDPKRNYRTLGFSTITHISKDFITCGRGLVKFRKSDGKVTSTSIHDWQKAIPKLMTEEDYAHYSRNNYVSSMLSFLQYKVYDDELTASELSVIEALAHRVKERTGR